MQYSMKKKLKQSAVSLVTLCLVASSSIIAGTAAEAAAVGTEAFDTSTGALNVDYASYLSKHDVVYKSPISDPKGALTVGNGRLGGMVRDTTNGLTMQLSGIDASEEGFASEGLVNLYSNPGFNTGYTSYEQRLSLYDGTLTNKYDANRKITFMGSPDSEVMGIHVEDSRVGTASISLDLSIWDVSKFGGGDVPDINTWKTISTFVDPTVVGFSRGQTDVNHFGYTMAATVEGASFTTQAVNGSKVRLNITPSSSYTIWIACASRLNAPSFDSITQAKTLLTGVKSIGYDTTLNNFKSWWHNFWSKSFVQYSNTSGDADYLENFYYLSTYIIAAGAYGNYPFHFINGVFSAVNDDDSGKWSNAYWYWNQRDVYHSFLTSNHPEMVNTFNNLYSRNFNTLKSYTMTRYGIDGIWVPETMGWNASASGTIGSTYTKDIYSTGTEAALNMYHQYQYTNDTAYLTNTVYPFMREAAKFYVGMLSYDSANDQYYMANSNAHEQYWGVKNAITDLAAIRAMFPIAIKVSQDLGQDSDLRAQWQTVLTKLVPYPVNPNDPTRYFPYTPSTPAASTRNDENTLEELVWPYSVTGIGAPDYQMAVNDFNNRQYPFGDNVWDPAPIQAARLGLGDATYTGLKTMVTKYQNYPNGRTTNTNGEFEYMGVNLTATNEALLQSYNDKIRVFPAVPTDTAFVSKFTLMASGGFQVSSEKENNEIKYVGLKSSFGKPATLVNPWGTAQVQVRRTSDNAIITTTSSNEFTFNTDAGAVYVVERTAVPLSSYTAAQITGTANQGVKSLSGTNAKLGLDASGGRVATTTFYADGSFGGTAVTLAPGTYTTAQLVTAGIQDNWASSVKVPAGYTVEVYDGNNFTGTKWVYTADADFPSGSSPNANDKMSSAKIYLTDGSTKFEAENGTLSSASNKYADSAASAGNAVQLAQTGDSLTFSGAPSASQLIFTYCTASNPGQISLYVNGVFSQHISFPTNGVWAGGYPTLTVPVSISGGSTIKFQLDNGDSPVNLDTLTFISMDLSKVGVDVASNLITGTTVDMEYSLDSTNGTDGTWTAAKAGNTTVVFTGGKVYVRDATDHNHFSLVATVPTVISQKYEAENGTTSGTTGKSNDSSASNGKMVDHFSVAGDSVSFTNVVMGSKLIVAYTTANNPSQLSLYINGTDSGNISFPTTNSWQGNYATVTVTKSIPAGATVKLQLDSGDSGANIDYIIIQSQDLSGVGFNQTSTQLTGTNPYMEYSTNSTDGSNGTWTVAQSGNTSIILTPGKIYVREAANHSNVKLLATIPGQKYEGENATLVAVSASGDSAASGGKAVTGFSTAGSSSAAFTSTAKGGQLVIGYTTANTNSKLTLYINGVSTQSVKFPNTNVWSGSYATVLTNVSIPAGAVVKLQLDNGDSGSNIDYFIVQPLDNLNGVAVNVASNQLTGTTPDMEYSLDSTDGTSGTWSAASAGNTSVNFVTGNVYARVAANPTTNKLLATIAAPASAPAVTANLSGGMSKVKLVGATTTMQYSLNGGSTWSNVTSSLASGSATLDVSTAPNDDLRVRVPATASALPSLATDKLNKVLTSSNTNIQLAASHPNVSAIDTAAQHTVTVLNGTTVAQISAQVTASDSSHQTYTVKDAGGSVKNSGSLANGDVLVVTAEDGTTQSSYTINVAPPTAADIAASLTSIVAPAKDATALTLPVVPNGYTVAVKSSDNTSVIGNDGTIIPPNVETTITLVLEVTRTSDNSKADTVALPVVVPAKTPLPTATLSVTSDVYYPGQSFDLTYGLSNIGPIVGGGIYAQEVTVNYDPAQLQLSAATSLLDGVFVSQAGTPGHIRIISASQGPAHAITADNSGAILKLSFQVVPAAQSVTSTVYLSGVAVANSLGIETQLQGASSNVQITVVDKAALNTLIASAQAKYNAAEEGSRPGQYPAGSKASLQAAITAAQTVINNSTASPVQVSQAMIDLNAALQSFLASINVAKPGDLSGDGKFSVGDLAIVASHYGENTNSPNWLASADINHDGLIDIIDLAAVAHDMISQE